MAGNSPSLVDRMVLKNNSVIETEDGTDVLTVTAGVPTLGYRKKNSEILTAAKTVTAAESGKTFYLNSSTEFACTLPTPALGLEYTFIVKAAPSGASYTIVSASGTDNIHGVAVSAADAGGSVDTTAGTAADTITFVDGQALQGDRVHLECDGTYWYADGLCSDEDAITFTQT